MRFAKRKASVNGPTDPEDRSASATIRIVDVVREKDQGYTVIVEVPPNAGIDSEESWKTILPGDFRGATRVDNLWHLYYGEKPAVSPGQTLILP
jgi:hypothetical protein